VQVHGWRVTHDQRKCRRACRPDGMRAHWPSRKKKIDTIRHKALFFLSFFLIYLFAFGRE
jgi:hypothetical protein